ncbi:MAG: hypothetical protein ACLTKE_08385 [Coprococcus sp.]
MRKYLEIEVPDEDMGKAEIDYIDLESLKVEESDKQWTIPRGKSGGIVQAGGVYRSESWTSSLIYIQWHVFRM